MRDDAHDLRHVRRLHEPVVRRDLKEAVAEVLDLQPVGRPDLRDRLGDHREQDDCLVEHLVVLPVVEEDDRARRAGSTT